MAIIKKQKQQPSQSENNNSEANAQPAKQSWSEETFEKGLVPDRRQNDRRLDRRRDYRRYEDKELITRAQQEARAIKDKAREEGFKQGLNQVQGELEALRGRVEELLLSREDALKSVANEVAPLAVAVAERIIKTEVSCDDELVLAIVNDTLKKVGRNSKNVLIKVNTDDLALVKRHMKQSPPENMDAEIIVLEDPMVDKGSCILETNSGLIDASLATRLEILRKLFGRFKPAEESVDEQNLNSEDEALTWLDEPSLETTDQALASLDEQLSPGYEASQASSLQNKTETN